jgi:hypothetical protein
LAAGKLLTVHGFRDLWAGRIGILAHLPNLDIPIPQQVKAEYAKVLSPLRLHEWLLPKCPTSRVVSMGRRNIKLEPTFH